MRSATLSLATLSLAPLALAWGDDGHEAVGYIAQAFLAPKALSFVKSSLGSTYNESLGVAAPWADTVKYETAYEWSKPYHFVDALDSPLEGSCSVVESRDCANGDCLLNAIANYTSRVQETSLSSTQRQEALKFLTHFIGDIGQPLHNENYEVGGNDITAECASYPSANELHAIWDTGIITTNLDANYDSTVTTWADSLVSQIKSGIYTKLTSDWIACNSTSEPASKTSAKRDTMSLIQHRAKIVPLACPLIWSQEANAYDCSYVFNYTEGTDLCSGEYYENAIPIIDEQIAKQGYRLAAWLNEIFDGAPVAASA